MRRESTSIHCEIAEVWHFHFHVHVIEDTPSKLNQPCNTGEVTFLNFSHLNLHLSNPPQIMGYFTMQEITQIVLFPLSKHPPVPTCLQQVTSYCNVTFTVIRPNTEKDNADYTL